MDLIRLLSTLILFMAIFAHDSSIVWAGIGRRNTMAKAAIATTTESPDHQSFSRNSSPKSMNDCFNTSMNRLNRIDLPAPSSPTTTTTPPNPSEEQLEEFIQSLKPQNMDALTLEDDHNETNLMNDDFELIDSNDRDDPKFESKFKSNSNHFEQMKSNHGPKQRQQRFKAAVLTRYSMEYRPIDQNFLNEFEQNRFNDQDNSSYHETEDDLMAEDNDQEDDQEMEGRIIEVIPKNRPLKIHFRSPSNQIQIIQSSFDDQTANPNVDDQQQSTAQEPLILEEKPRLYYQQIRKPIVQHLHEIILPYRKVIQEIKPVIEQVHTVVTKRQPAVHHQSSIQQPQSSKFNNINDNIISNRSPISRFKQFQQANHHNHQQNQRFMMHSNDEQSSTTLSPLLLGVEQMVDPSSVDAPKLSSSPFSTNAPSWALNGNLRDLTTNHHHAQHHSPQHHLLAKELLRKSSMSPSSSTSSMIEGHGRNINYVQSSTNQHHQRILSSVFGAKSILK